MVWPRWWRPRKRYACPSPTAPQIQVFDPQARLRELLDKGQGLPTERCAVVHRCDAGSLGGAMDAALHGLIQPVLIGPEGRLRSVAEDAGIGLNGIDILGVEHSHAAAEKAVELAALGDVGMLMKGSLHTDELLRAVLSSPALRTGRRLSHVFRFDVPLYPKPLLITDAALNIRPTLAEKADIIQNAIDFARMLGGRAAQGGHPLGGGDGEPPTSPRRSMPPRCARWQTAARSRVGCWTGRWPSTTPSQAAARIDQGDCLAGGGPGRHPGRARPGEWQHAGQAAWNTWRAPAARAWCWARACRLP